MAAAEGIYRVINTHMAEGIRLVSVRRGVDPRRFAILSFGGAAALHVTDVARQLDLERVIVPRLSAVLSAWGMLACEPAMRGGANAYRRRQPSRCHGEYARPSARWRPRVASGSRLHRSRAQSACGRPPTCATASRCSRWACRSTASISTAPDLLQRMADAFHARHEELYTYSLRDQEAVLVNARVAVIGELPALPQEPALPARPAGDTACQRRIYLGGWREVPIYEFDALAPGQAIEGPAVIEFATTSVLLRPGDRLRTTAFGWLDIQVGPNPDLAVSARLEKLAMSKSRQLAARRIHAARQHPHGRLALSRSIPGCQFQLPAPAALCPDAGAREVRRLLHGRSPGRAQHADRGAEAQPHGDIVRAVHAAVRAWRR